LKERQDSNAADKKMMNILSAIGVKANRDNAGELFADYVVERVSIDGSGRKVNATQEPVDATDKEDPFSIEVMKDYRSQVKAAVKAADGDAMMLQSALESSDCNFLFTGAQKTMRISSWSLWWGQGCGGQFGGL
jgi:hypothetical protein